MLKRPKSLSSLLLTHEIAFLFLVTVTGVISGMSAYFWQINSAESVRINEMKSITEEIRSSLFRQIQAAIRVRVLEDPKSLDVYSEYSRLIDKQFNALRSKSISRDEDGAIQDLQQSYREIQKDMNKIFTDPYISDFRVRMKILDPRFAESMVNKFEQRYRSFRDVLDEEHETLDMTLEQWSKYAPFVIPVPIIMAILLILFARNILKRGFVKPMFNVIQGAQIISKGEFDHQIPEKGVEEVSDLANSINHMAQDLEESRDALIQSEKQAALGTLVPVVAHNIRNPLAAIRATAQVLEDAENKSELQEGSQAIVETIDRLGRWVNSLVSYLHPLKPNKRTILMDQLLTSTIDALKPKLEEKNIRLERTDWDEISQVDVDQDLMEQAIYGLLANAVDASSKSSTLKIGFKPESNVLVIRIEDEGGGLPFEPKPSDLEPGPSSKRFGTGLGIPIAYKICQTHGWSLQFNIEQGQGTEVIITVPINNT